MRKKLLVFSVLAGCTSRLLVGAPAGASPSTRSYAAPTWSLSQPPNPSAPNGMLNGISCPSSTSCVAVGGYDNASGQQRTLTQARNGSTWSTQPSANPSGSRSNELFGVSCLSPTSCTAVGESWNSVGTPVTLAERWNGSVWTIQSTPNPSGATHSVFDAVSCTSATACTAVGSSGIGNVDTVGVTLAERWNGTSWSIQPTPDPSAGSGVADSSLLGVSCSATTACTSVGQYFSPTTHQDVTLAESWNGSGWTTVATPNPSGSFQSELTSVSCTAASACRAVGDFTNSSGTQATLAEASNGTTWSVQTTPNATAATGDRLIGVACTASTSCVAVGAASTATTVRPLAEAWNGATWSLQTPANPAASVSAALVATSCASATSCTAVGTYSVGGTNVPLTEARSGTSWTDQSTPTPSGEMASELDGVSCASSASCVAVGRTENKSGVVAMSESWNGSSWSLLPTANPVSGSLATLYAVSCPTSTTCVAVGSYTNTSNVTVPISEVWNGSSWSLKTAAIPSGSNGTSLLSIACTASNSCTAVGYYFGAAGIDTVAESWNGTSWTVRSTPALSGSSFAQLDSVACTAANTCESVGVYSNSMGVELPLAESWNGTKWSAQSIPTPASGTGALVSVSCTATSQCTAVGNAADDELTLAERWNGTNWSAQSTPNVSGSQSNSLYSVSCTSSTACTVVGEYSTPKGDTTATLGEFWDGTTWAITSTPNDHLASTNELAAIACPLATSCLAVGSAGISGGTESVLAARSA